MDGCKRIRIRELFKSMNVCRLQSVMKYDWITNLLQVCYWTPLEFNYLYSFTRVTLYYNLYRPCEGGEWIYIQALSSHFGHITSGLHFSSILQSRTSANFLFSYPQFLQNLLFPSFLDVIPPGIPPAPNFPCGFGPIVQDKGDESSQY